MMNKSVQYIRLKSWQRKAMHVLFWFLSLSFFWLLFSRSSTHRLNAAIFIAILSPIAIFTTYFFNYRLIPRFLISGSYFRFFWYATVTSVIAIWLSMMGGILIWVWRAQFKLGEISMNTIDVPMLVAALFFVVFMGVSAKLTRLNIASAYESEMAEKERLALDNQLKINELKFLKEQLNPHFLFNTLNNLYGLTLEKSDKAPDLVMRLSDILDYMLYRTNTEKVPLVQEIQVIENYIAIEKYRSEGRCNISFSVEGKYDQLGIAPLLFLPLVENCFKHGVRKSIRKPFVAIALRVKEHVVEFETENKIFHANEEQQGGIGKHNLVKRLEMLYPGRYSFKNFVKDKKYFTHLKIQLKTNQ